MASPSQWTYEFKQAPGDGEGQGSLVCYSPWGRKESGVTGWLNNSDSKPSPGNGAPKAACYGLCMATLLLHYDILPVHICFSHYLQRLYQTRTFKRGNQYFQFHIIYWISSRSISSISSDFKSFHSTAAASIISSFTFLEIMIEKSLNESTEHEETWSPYFHVNRLRMKVKT